MFTTEIVRAGSVGGLNC